MPHHACPFPMKNWADAIRARWGRPERPSPRGGLAASTSEDLLRIRKGNGMNSRLPATQETAESMVRYAKPISEGVGVLPPRFVLWGPRKIAIQAIFLFAKPKCDLGFAYIFKRVHARKWQGIPAPHGHL